jgi:hypothetical protein
MDCRRAGMVLTLLPPKEEELARELLLSQSIRVNVESARRRQPSFCSNCKEENEGNGQHIKEAWICMNKQGQTCFSDIVTNQH